MVTENPRGIKSGGAAAARGCREWRGRPGHKQDMNRAAQLKVIQERIVACRLCPRLVKHREKVARVKRRAFLREEYWGRPVPGFGDFRARLLILGLAPAAHGGNRTGRVFTGDRSGDFLFAMLHRAGFASQPESVRRDDGLALRDAYIAAAARCAPPDNRPLPGELLNCRAFLRAEADALRPRAVLALGRIAFDAWLALADDRGLPLRRSDFVFRHGARYTLPDGTALFASYHPSQQNTQTGRLTGAMFLRVLRAIRRFLKRSGRGGARETKAAFRRRARRRAAARSGAAPLPPSSRAPFRGAPGPRE
jgi:uracil-DNA glycosylase family 4